jgi:hypothetical protein
MAGTVCDGEEATNVVQRMTTTSSAWQLVRVFSNTFLRFCLPSRN